jgi:hypothetical protein
MRQFFMPGRDNPHSRRPIAGWHATCNSYSLSFGTCDPGSLGKWRAGVHTRLNAHEED